MDRSEEFLDLYKKLEETLEARQFHGQKRRVGNAVVDYMNSREGSRFREELNLCREVRNLLSHHARFRGVGAVEPAETLVTFLKNLLRFLENPPTALDVCTKKKDLMCAKKQDSLLSVLGDMERRGFSHVPVMRGRHLYGVLSVSTLFSYFREHPDQLLGRNAMIEKLWDALPTDCHATERFEFVNPLTTYEDIRDLFNEGGPQKKRLAAVFVTEGGTKNGALLGMITPWDMLRAEPEV